MIWNFFKLKCELITTLNLNCRLDLHTKYPTLLLFRRELVFGEENVKCDVECSYDVVVAVVGHPFALLADAGTGPQRLVSDYVYLYTGKQARTGIQDTATQDNKQSIALVHKVTSTGTQDNASGVQDNMSWYTRYYAPSIRCAYPLTHSGVIPIIIIRNRSK